MTSSCMTMSCSLKGMAVRHLGLGQRMHALSVQLLAVANDNIIASRWNQTYVSSKLRVRVCLCVSYLASDRFSELPKTLDSHTTTSSVAYIPRIHVPRQRAIQTASPPTKFPIAGTGTKSENSIKAHGIRSPSITLAHVFSCRICSPSFVEISIVIDFSATVGRQHHRSTQLRLN